MPIIQQLVTTVMGKERDFSIDPMEAVALGATIQGARFANEIDFLAPLRRHPSQSRDRGNRRYRTQYN